MQKKSLKKTFGKIGLFLIFGVMIWNVGGYSKNNGEITLNALNEANASWANWVLYGDSERTGGEAISGAYGGFRDAAQTVTQNFDEDPIVKAFNYLLYYIAVAISALIKYSAMLFDMSLNTEALKNSLQEAPVYLAWSMVRDFLNLFFMIALLFSAFATIFQVEKYHLKKMIIMLVVMALLVNFSYPITLFIIDFSNSIMHFFVQMLDSARVTVDGQSFSSKSALVAKFVEIAQVQESIISGTVAATVALLLTIIFLFVLFVTLFALAINLVIRNIAFLILLVLSPVGFALFFFSSTRGVADSWWNALFKYAIMGPAIIFFVVLASMFFTENNRDIQVSENFLVAFVKFSVPVVFLWFGLIASQKFGGAASGVAMSVVKSTGNKIRGYAQKGVRFGAHWADRKMAEGTKVSYMGLKQGWKDRQARLDSKAMAKSSGKMEDVIEHVISRVAYGGVANAVQGFEKDGFWGAIKEVINPSSRDKTSRDLISKERIIASEGKEITDTNTESSHVINELKTAIGGNDTKRVQAALRILAQKNDLNDMMKTIGHDYGMGTNNVSPETVREAVGGILNSVGMKDNNLGRELMKLSNIAVASGNSGFAGMGNYNEITNKYSKSNNRQQAEAAVLKFKEREGLARQKDMHPGTLLSQTSDGWGAPDYIQKEVWKEISGVDKEHVRRTQDRLRSAIIDVRKAGGLADVENDTKNSAVVKKYIDAIENMQLGIT